jgi:hypothetical protein
MNAMNFICIHSARMYQNPVDVPTELCRAGFPEFSVSSLYALRALGVQENIGAWVAIGIAIGIGDNRES